MAAKDSFNAVTGKESPAEDIFSITPDDGNELEYVTRGFVFGVTGAIKILTLNDTEITIPEGVLSPGVIHPIRVKKVFATGTTASNIFGLI